MNKKIFSIMILLVFVGAIFIWPGDEKEINAHLTSLAKSCSSQKEEPVLETLQKAALAAKLCSDPCTVQIESLKIDRSFRRKELTDNFLILKKRLPNTEFSFHDTVIEILGDGRAEVTTTLRLNGKKVDDQFTDAYELNISMEKKDGEWCFSSFTVVEFMKK